jgi:transposase
METSVVEAQSTLRAEPAGVEPVLTVEEVTVMKSLWRKGWGIKGLSRELGHGRNTVRKWVRAWRAGLEAPVGSGSGPGRPRSLQAVAPDWLRSQLLAHQGNADVVRQELVRTHGISPSLRTVERAVVEYRRELRAEKLATVRFETAPGKQIQADFGVKVARIGGEPVRVYLCVLTLGYSRRTFVQAFTHERQENWLTALERAFLYFGGVCEEVLVDNARALVKHNDGQGNVVFNAEFLAFCEHWGIRPRACGPYRARTKGKDERAVQYVKRNAMAGHEFASWEALEAHLGRWMREVADQRVHGTTGDQPIARFETEKRHLLSLGNQVPYRRQRSWKRKVPSDCLVNVSANLYSVPYRLIGLEVDIVENQGWLEFSQAGHIVARHREAVGVRGAKTIEPAHLEGIFRLLPRTLPAAPAQTPLVPLGDSTLLRPLCEYEEIVAASGGVL